MKNAAKKAPLAPLLPAKPAADPVEKFVEQPKRRVQAYLPHPTFTKMAIHCAERDIDFSEFIAEAVERALREINRPAARGSIRP